MGSALHRDTLELGTVEIANYGQPDTDYEYFAQIGVYSTIENAKNAWWEFTSKVPGDTQNYAAIAKPERKGTRTRYALQAGPFSRRDAWKLCRALASDCYPAHVSDSKVAFDYAPKISPASAAKPESPQNEDAIVTLRSLVNHLADLDTKSIAE
jgi:hypothetical protein